MLLRRFLLGLVFPVLWGVLAPGAALAAASDFARDPDVAVRLIAAQDDIGPATADLAAGLEIDLGEGWHTYWRSPGLAGQPPQLVWTGSGNLRVAQLLYPVPHRFEAAGLDAIGYQGRVVLPLRLALDRPGAPLDLKLGVDLLVCQTLCVPKHFTLTLSLPGGAGNPGAEAAAIEAAFARVPPESSDPLSLKRIARTPHGVEVEAFKADGWRAPDLFFDNDDGLIAEGRPAVALSSDRRTATLTVPLSADETSEAVWTKPSFVTVTDGAASLEKRIEPSVWTTAVPAPASAPAPEPETSLAFILLLAFVGGFILNLMPCVLPVLSLKLMGLIRHGGGEPRLIRRSFVATAMGIVFSFLVLAAGTAALKAAGHAVGWGLHFQNPLFLVVMMAVLTVFAMNLWGAFEIAPPQSVMRLLNGPHAPRLAGDFVTGALATLLATPCSAPFLGTAVAFALAAGTAEIFAVFAALGVGMAAPYLMVAAWPRLARALPKPGRWMPLLSKVLGVGLAATALWLLFLLRHQMGRGETALVGLAMAAIGVATMLPARALWRVLAGVLFVGALGSAMGMAYVTSAPSSRSPVMGAWTRFDEATLAEKRREGKTVFVDVTADWCLTCKANKRFALTREAVQERLFKAGPNVVALQADWTTPNPDVVAFLKKHRRPGIPFNVVFGPGAPEGIVLPELLTPRLVIDALDRAEGRKAACPADQASC